MSSFVPARALAAPSLYRTLWRWHFYAGLFVIPFVVVLALSGALFLFKPQVDRWEERAFLHLPSGHATPGAQVQAALDSIPGSRFHSYRLPRQQDDAAMVHLALADGAMRDVFVSPRGEVLGSLDPDARIIAFVRRLHGQLLLGPRGSWLVELAASWAIVMLVTGLYLWWPRGRGFAGVVWPRRRSLLRDLHAVTGFWVAGLALVLLLTGLPWADAWGNALRAVRTQMGWVQGPQDWSVGGRALPASGSGHSGHDHAAMQGAAMDIDLAMVDALAAKAPAEGLAFPVLVIPPGAPRDFTGETSSGWTLKSDAQNRPLVTTITYDGTGSEIARQRFGDQHPIDQVIGYGVAWHEGQLFGALNQAIGVTTALALVTMAITGFLMWRRRRPQGVLGAPPLPAERRKPVFVAIATLLLALYLPLLAASLVLLWLFDLLLPRLSPAAAAWLGITAPRA